MEQNKVMESEDFLNVKSNYSYLSEAVHKLNKSNNLFLLVDYTGTSIIVYDLKKLKKGFEKNKSASFFHESISDKFYKVKFKDSEKQRIINSLIKLISSRLEVNNGIEKQN
jgi:hypothetical protein